jgi:protein involved in polysaccharide export with SLBB domain
VIRADPLIRVGIVGEVAHPGYYRVPLATTLSDALMIAGGPTPQTDLTRISVRRGQRTVIGASSLRDAMVRGEYLGDLGVDAGDEIVLTPIPTKNWMLITQLGGLATGLVLALHAFKAF